MGAVTLELVKAKQVELAEMIQQLQDEANETLVVQMPAVEITLRAGEAYAGVVLDERGNLKHHLVLLPQRPDERLNWKDAIAWAKEVGGDLPTRQEQSLLFANCKPHLEADWHWSSEVYEPNSEYAWCCHFSRGTQHYGRQNHGGCAVAVRMIPMRLPLPAIPEGKHT